MVTIDTKVRELVLAKGDSLLDTITACSVPVVFKGLVANWPSVQASTKLAEYLTGFAADVPVQSMCAKPEADGRYFYNEDLSGFNFTRIQTNLKALLEVLESGGPSGLYMGSTTLDYCLPGFAEQNPLALPGISPLVSAWIGNQTRVAAHFDVPENIACVVGGKRRFVLFPPEQVENLYVGPLDFTPAGQPISLVDMHNIDFDRFPRFKLALANAQVAELEAGDAIYIPSMWWHQVEALDQLNMLVNYWWRETPAFQGQPLDALHHAISTLRDLPIEQKKAFKSLFEYYVFADDLDCEHIPEQSRGMLGKIDEQQARQIRAGLLRNLNR